MRKIALLTVTPQQHRYYVPCVFSCLLWRWAGWEPHVLAYPVAGHDWADPLPAFCLDAMRDTGATIHHRPDWAVPGWSQHRTFHLATAPRRLAAALLFDPADYILLGDADMLTLRADYFGTPAAGELTVWGSDMYHADPNLRPRWPACYQGACAREWGLIMRPASADPEAAAVAHMNRTRAEAIRLYTKWDCEPGFHAEMNASGYDRVTCYARHQFPLAGRLYLAPQHPSPPDPIDCHIRADWYAEGKWRRFLADTPALPPQVKTNLDLLRNQIRPMVDAQIANEREKTNG